MEFDFFKQFKDEDYFSDPLVFGLLSAMRRIDGESIIRIGGPRIWDPKLHAEYLGSVGFKFSPEKNDSYDPAHLAKMILVESATGSTEILNFPVPEKKPVRSPAPASTSKDDVLSQKVIRLPAARSEGPWGSRRLFVYSGCGLSNPLDFETGHRELTEKDRRIPPHLLREPTEQELSSQVFAQRPASPKLDAPGIAFAQEATEASIDGKRSIRPLDLTVYIPDDFPPQQRWVSVRLLFGSNTSWANHNLEVLIPKERTTKVEGGLLAHYTLDLAPLLVDSSTGKPVQPREWYLTAICKGVFTGPTSLAIPAK